MKLTRYILMGMILLAVFTSCKKDQSPVLTHSEPSVLDNLPSQNYVLAEPVEDTNPLLLTVTWTETQFYLDRSTSPQPLGPVNYTLQIDKKGNAFANPQVVAATNGLSANIFVSDMNLLLLQSFGAKPGESIDMEMRIVADYGKNLARIAISGNTLPLTITPYAATPKMQMMYLRILGDTHGEYPSGTRLVMYRNSSNPNDETYTFTGRLAAGTSFKFIPEESLGTNKSYCRKDESTLVYEDRADGAFTNTNEGYVTINVNLKDMTYSIAPFDASSARVYTTMGPIGGFCGWDNEPPMTVSSYDPHQWTLVYEFAVSTACKFRGNRDWGNNWGGGADDFPFGKGVFDGPGANVAKPGKYRIHFNDLTGHYIILLQK